MVPRRVDWSRWLARVDSVNVLEAFVCGYTGVQKGRIDFAWNHQHAEQFHDANQEFRFEVVSFVCENPGAAPVELIRDLFAEQAKWAREAWAAPFHFSELGELLLTRGGTGYLMDFLQSFAASFDTFGACHQMRLDPVTTASLLREVERRLGETTDEQQRSLLESGRDLFEKVKAGKGSEGWVMLPAGTPIENVRVVSGPQLTWLRFKQFIVRALRASDRDK